MQAPVLTDTEPETSIELDKSVRQMTRSETANMTKSVFNITLENILHEHESVELKDYESGLREEFQSWAKLWRNTLRELKQFKQNPHPILDFSYLPAEKRAYLEKAPDIHRFVRDSVEFRQAANIFLEKDVEQITEMQENLLELCERHINIAKENKIAENLSSYSK